MEKSNGGALPYDVSSQASVTMSTREAASQGS
jgi:hypothetical protein